MDENLPKDKTSGRTGETNSPQMPVLNTSDIIGRTFLIPPQEYGQNFRVHIVKMIDNHKTKLEKDPDHTQFICSVYDYQYIDIMSYNDIISHITKQEDENIVWKFKRIVSHEGPLN